MRLSEQSLTDFLKEKDLNPRIQEEHKQLFIEFQVKGQTIPLFFAVLGNGHLLQTIAYLPYTIPEDKFCESARLLHKLNRELDMPGFGMDEEHKVLFYRNVIFYPKAEFDSKILQVYIEASKVACDGFIDSISKLISEE